LLSSAGIDECLSKELVRIAGGGFGRSVVALAGEEVAMDRFRLPA
jgi:hypothetical protein